MQQILTIVREELLQPVPSAVAKLAAELTQRHMTAWLAVLFYGSCLRRGEAALFDPDSLLDFYVLVDDYDLAYPQNPVMAWANRLLPPNVYFIEVNINGQSIRAKYAVMSMAQFVQGCSAESRTSTIWARFAQPARLIAVRNEAARLAVEAACADAAATFLAAVLPLLGDRFSAEHIWEEGFRATYGAELRSEHGNERASIIFAADRARYCRVVAAALERPIGADPSSQYENPLDAVARDRGRRAWFWRRMTGKTFNLLRLIKAVFTFDGAVDYALWKVERHSGVRPPVSAWERRHPILAAPVLLWRFYRAGAFR
jgi:hypothetical protein